jgi:dihydrofolate reductase
MRKVLAGLGVSLDFYIARPDGAVDFLLQPKDYSPSEFFDHVDAGIMGRKTYEDGLKMGGDFSAYKGWKFYVLSRTLAPGERDGVTITRNSPQKIVADLRKRKGKDIWLMGGGETIRDFLEADLVDEIHLGVVPVLIGEGRPLFLPGYPQREFKLLENKTYGKAMVALRYERVRKRRPQ